MASVNPKVNPSGKVVWRVQFRVNGRVSQETFPSETGARQFGQLVDKVGGDAARRVLKARQEKTQDMPTLREFTAQYLDPASGLLTGIEPGTRAGYERIAAKSFLQILGDYPVDAIERSDVGRWIAWQEAQPSGRTAGQPMAAKTVRNYHALLSAVMSMAVQEKIRPDNPAYKTVLSKGRKRDGVFLTRNEVATLLHFVPDYYQPLVLFLFATGTRWGEATAVTWGDLELSSEPPTVRIDKAWKKAAAGAPVLKHPKTSRSRRTISLWPELVTALGDPGPGDKLIFHGPQSEGHLWYGRFRERIWVPAVNAANDPQKCAAAGLTPIGKRPNIHDARHTHASLLISEGVPMPYVQARLGHENIQTTIQTYTHIMPDAHRQMSAVMSRAMTNVLPTLEQGGQPLAIT